MPQGQALDVRWLMEEGIKECDALKQAILREVFE